MFDIARLCTYMRIFCPSYYENIYCNLSEYCETLYTYGLLQKEFCMKNICLAQFMKIHATANVLTYSFFASYSTSPLFFAYCSASIFLALRFCLCICLPFAVSFFLFYKRIAVYEKRENYLAFRDTGRKCSNVTSQDSQIALFVSMYLDVASDSLRLFDEFFGENNGVHRSHVCISYFDIAKL